ncbi:MAG: ECF-type sigma factor [Tahibacter sp.]
MSDDITQLLRTHHQGDREAFDRLMPLVYERLCAIARRQLARGGRGHTLDTGALVQEAYFQLIDETGVPWQDRGHFFAICARTMRRILVDFARRRQALKRGGGMADASLDPDLIVSDEQSELLLSVDAALEKLGEFNERLGQVVECRFFAGMTEEETAQAMNASLRSVQRDWMRARAWLQKALA